LIILIFVVLPGLCNCDAVGACISRMDELGINADLFM
jgi:hypothetical protein